MKARIFIASSSEALPYAKQFKVLLEENPRFFPVVWNEEGVVFKTAQTYIESLVSSLSNFEYAVMIFHPDDFAEIKGKKTVTTRDNVVFEYGLFVGWLGRDHCYIVQPENIPLRIPSDLFGVTNANYKFLNTKNKKRISQLMTPAANLIASRIAEVNKEIKAPPRNIQIINSYMHMASTQLKTYTKLEECIRMGRTLPEEILYWSVESSTSWLNYEQETFENANAPLALLARAIEKISVGENINFISLGCGSGAKDVLIINMLRPNERAIGYFPIDQSYTLLENAIQEILGRINADDLFVRGIRADFRQLHSFSNVFKSQVSKNLFSLLGCTLGNYDEVSLLDTISACMNPGDLFILEVGSVSDELAQKLDGDIIESGKYADIKLQDFLLSPIKPFVKSVQRNSIQFVANKNDVTVTGSIRVIVRFDNKELPDQPPFDIAFSTHYTEKELKKFLTNQKLETIFTTIHKKNIYLLCRKMEE